MVCDTNDKLLLNEGRASEFQMERDRSIPVVLIKKTYPLFTHLKMYSLCFWSVTSTFGRTIYGNCCKNHAASVRNEEESPSNALTLGSCEDCASCTDRAVSFLTSMHCTCLSIRAVGLSVDAVGTSKYRTLHTGLDFAPWFRGPTNVIN